MAQCNNGSPVTLFGVHSVTLYDRCTRNHYGTLRVLQGSSLSLSSELISLNGGSSKFAWGIERGLITAEASLTFSEYAPFLDEVFLGKKATVIAADADGDVSAAANAEGLSVIDAVTGADSVIAKVGEEADLKFARYVLTAGAGNLLDLYASSDVDFGRGTEAAFLGGVNSTLVAQGIDLSLGNYDVAGFGITIVAGSGAIALVEGDSAVFEVLPIHAAEAYETTVGGLNDVFSDFGMIMYAAKSGSGQLFEIDLFRCAASGMPHNFSANEFSEAEVTVQAFYDANRSGVFSKRVIAS